MSSDVLKVFLLLFLSILLFSSCFRLRVSDRKTSKKFQKQKAEVNFKRHSLVSVKYPVRVVSGKFDSLQNAAIFFVHGAPGSSDNYYKYLKDSILLSKANLYSIDRPGYGFSNFGKAETSIVKQAEVTAEILNSLPEENIIVVGHSYGGPIAAYASLISPKIKNVIMLAPAIDPSNEKIFWIAYLAKWKLTKWMIPGAMGVAGDEKFTHVSELEKIKNDWEKIKVPVLHIHGTKDIVVPFENLSFSVKKFNPQYLDTIVLQKENHFLPWKRYDLVKQELIKMLEKIDE